jgi:hypothetical protein
MQKEGIWPFLFLFLGELLHYNALVYLMRRQKRKKDDDALYSGGFAR